MSLHGNPCCVKGGGEVEHLKAFSSNVCDMWVRSSNCRERESMMVLQCMLGYWDCYWIRIIYCVSQFLHVVVCVWVGVGGWVCEREIKREREHRMWVKSRNLNLFTSIYHDRIQTMQVNQQLLCQLHANTHTLVIHQDGQKIYRTKFWFQ